MGFLLMYIHTYVIKNWTIRPWKLKMQWHRGPHATQNTPKKGSVFGREMGPLLSWKSEGWWNINRPAPIHDDVWLFLPAGHSIHSDELFINRSFVASYYPHDVNPRCWKSHCSISIQRGFCDCYWEVMIPTFWSRWCFQIFFIFTPIWGSFPFWLIFFNWAETTK